MEIHSEALKISLSKIAPLEQWNVSWTRGGPRICWALFRPKQQQLEGLWGTIRSFKGQTEWHLVDNCLVPGAALVQAPGQPLVAPSTAAPPRAQINEEGVNQDLAALASEIEMRLDLREAKQLVFSKEMLTKEGLRNSRAPFEDFQDRGLRTVYLIVKPEPEVFEATKNDIALHFEPKLDELEAIFGDIVGADLSQRDNGTLTDAELDKIEKIFPVLLKISHYDEGAYLNVQDVEALSRECTTLDQIVSSSKSLRGLDKLTRIANWASTKHYGVFFSPL